MKTAYLRDHRQSWILLLCLVFHLSGAAAQFVDLTVQLETDDWDYWFFQDRPAVARTGSEDRSLFRKPATVHCVIGTNTWLMEGGDFSQNAKVTCWFTGTNIVQHSVITQEVPDSVTKLIAQTSRFALTSPPVGQQSTRIYETIDGNPGRPIRVTDLLELRGRICWLAFCSGSALKREGRQLFPPSDMWKEVVPAPNGFTDTTTCFKDELGLPRSVELFEPQGRRAFQYQVHQTTNIAGWEIPLEFYGVQYRAAQTNGWEVQSTFKGRVTAIGVGREPEPPKTGTP